MKKILLNEQAQETLVVATIMAAIVMVSVLFV